jgi:hypothetical protein
MKGHDFVMSLLAENKVPRAVYIEFDGKPDAYLDYPVVVVGKFDYDYRWIKGLVAHVTGVDSDAVARAAKELLRCGAARVFAHYTESKFPILWDSKVDA